MIWWIGWPAQRDRKASIFPGKLSPCTAGDTSFHILVLLSHSDGMPPACTTGLHAFAPELPQLHEHQQEAQGIQKSRDEHHVLDLRASIGSANVASMYNGTWGHAGKTIYLRQQFQAMRMLFLGLQETRTPETFSTADGVLRFGSGHAEGGLYGVEIWVNLHIPFGSIDKEMLYFQAADFQVLHRDPRVLFVRAENQYIQWAIIAGYAPHSGLAAKGGGHTNSMIASQKRPDDQLFVIIDANADPGPRDDLVVHRDGFKTTANTSIFRTFLHEHGLTLPATSLIHEGTNTTWKSPNGIHEHSIDHIAVAHDLLHDCTFSAVLEDFDLGTGLYDHAAVGLQLEWRQALAPPISPGLHIKHQGRGCDYDKVQHEHLQTVLGSYRAAEWHHDVEQHVDELNYHLLHGLARLCPKSKTKPKKNFISDEVWHLHLCKLERRKALKELTLRHRFEVLAACFSALRTDKQPDPVAF
jgi:hypothetical protein